MSLHWRWFLILSVCLALISPVWGQQFSLDDPPKLLVPKQPPTRQEIQHRASLHKYVLGLLLTNEEKLDDALAAFAEAARLDPEAPAVYKAQVPLLIALGRMDDAMKACQQVVRLDPGDFTTWYIEAKLYKSQVRYADAIAALERGVKSASLKDHPEAAQQIYFELGSLYETLEKFGPAADAFNKAASILEHPDLIMQKAQFPRAAIDARAAETYEKIARLYRKAKQYEQAIAALKKAQQHAPARAPRMNYDLAAMCIEQGQFKQALQFVEAYLRTQPLGTEAYEMKIDLLLRLKQSDALVPWLEDAAARDKLNGNLQLLLAKEYARAKLATKAEQLFKKLAEESPSADLYRGLFHLYKQEGGAGMLRILTMLNQVIEKVNRDDAPTPLSNVTHARAMVAALREDAELGRALVKIAYGPSNQAKIDLKFDTLYFLATLADRQQKGAEAERFFRLCIANFDAKTTLTMEYLVYNGLLRALGRERKHEAMIEVCRKVLKDNHFDASATLSFLEKLARAQASLHRYDEALKNVEVGLTRSGDDNKLYFKVLRVRILTMADRFDDAETDCQAMLKTYSRQPDVVEVRYLLSNIYSAAKKRDKAEEQLQFVLKIDPDNATVNNDLAYLWAEQNKNLEAAESMIRKALEQDREQRRSSPNYSVDSDKDNAAYVDSLGWVLFRRGRIEEARKELERATTLNDGDDPVIFDHLGDVYSRLKMNAEASRSWQRALELYEQGLRRKEDDRVRDLQRKIKLLADQ